MVSKKFRGDSGATPQQAALPEHISKKIKIWAPYFMSILIEWYNEYFPNGQKKIKPPQCVISHNNSYRTNNDEWNDFFTMNKVIKTNNNDDKFKIKELLFFQEMEVTRELFR